MKFSILYIGLLLGSTSASIQSCGGVSTLEGGTSTVYPNRTVQLHTQWAIPQNISQVPLQVKVEDAISFPLDGCGDHLTKIEGGLVTVQVRGIPCPSSSGRYPLTLTVALPTFVPHGTYQIRMDGGSLLCAEARLQL